MLEVNCAPTTSLESAEKKAQESLFTFKQCITQIKEVYIAEDDTSNHASFKHNIIGELLRRYYRSEEESDLFEGFLHLLVSLNKFVAEIKGFEDNTLATQVLNNFYEYIDKLELIQQETVLECLPEDKEVFVGFIYI